MSAWARHVLRRACASCPPVAAGFQAWSWSVREVNCNSLEMQQSQRLGAGAGQSRCQQSHLKNRAVGQCPRENDSNVIFDSVSEKQQLCTVNEPASGSTGSKHEPARCAGAEPAGIHAAGVAGAPGVRSSGCRRPALAAAPAAALLLTTLCRCVAVMSRSFSLRSSWPAPPTWLPFTTGGTCLCQRCVQHLQHCKCRRAAAGARMVGLPVTLQPAVLAGDHVQLCTQQLGAAAVSRAAAGAVAVPARSQVSRRCPCVVVPMREACPARMHTIT